MDLLGSGSERSSAAEAADFSDNQTTKPANDKEEESNNGTTVDSNTTSKSQPSPPQLMETSHASESSSIKAPMSEGGQVEIEGGLSNKDMTPANTSNTEMSESRRRKVTGLPQLLHEVFGRETRVECSGSFPNAGSQLGPYFFFQTIGKGTFSSIHKCVNLDYFHSQQDGIVRQPRVAVAKIELANFVQSGVLEAEATVLDYLSNTLPAGSVPKYMGHFRSVVPDPSGGKDKVYAAIVMEYLHGQDMHVLRERVMMGSHSRRMAVPDAVFLTADVMLPLLKQMHMAGIVHRDVKPSNCVRSSDSGKDFCIVDFGLSKSIVETGESPIADKKHPWIQENWLKPHNYKGSGGYYRLEREKAEFRGTSMYASLRVHQEKDYSPRDDIWSLLYVFCDLVSGGLPWMSQAANRDRKACHRTKEIVHGLGSESEKDKTQLLLMGDQYHVAKYRREAQKAAGEQKLSNIPDPLEMSKDEEKVEFLRKSFTHLASLQFWDMPDYDLIRECIKGFLKDKSNHQEAKPIKWNDDHDIHLSPQKSISVANLTVPMDPVDTDMFQDADGIAAENPATTQVDDWMATLPIELRFYMAQLQRDVKHERDVHPAIGLRDWLLATEHLLNKEWDARQCEGENRTSTDGLRRDKYLRCLKMCRSAAKAFGGFQDPTCYTTSEEGKDPTKKRRRLYVELGRSRKTLVNVSQALWGLEAAITAEEGKRSAPPARIIFGS